MWYVSTFESSHLDLNLSRMHAVTGHTQFSGVDLSWLVSDGVNIAIGLVVALAMFGENVPMST